MRGAPAITSWCAPVPPSLFETYRAYKEQAGEQGPPGITTGRPLCFPEPHAPPRARLWSSGLPPIRQVAMTDPGRPRDADFPSRHRTHRDPRPRQLTVHAVPVGSRSGARPLAVALVLGRVVDALAAHRAAAVVRTPAALERVPAQVLVPCGPRARGTAFANGVGRAAVVASQVAEASHDGAAGLVDELTPSAGSTRAVAAVAAAPVPDVRSAAVALGVLRADAVVVHRVTDGSRHELRDAGVDPRSAIRAAPRLPGGTDPPRPCPHAGHPHVFPRHVSPGPHILPEQHAWP